jgi:DNA-binding Lrp family transcriptional regulator
MHTIKEVAESVNVSKTSVYNLIKKLGIQSFKREGKTYLDDNAISIIAAHYSTEQHDTINDIILETLNPQSSKTTKSFHDGFQPCNDVENAGLIKILEDERNEKNKIIQALIQSNHILSQALAAEKVSDAALMITQETDYKYESPPKGRWFKWLFNKKNRTIR